MANSSLLTVVWLTLALPTAVLGYYCDSGRCEEDEYCCGQNICCASYAVWQMWYFWCGIVFFMIMLSACAGFCRYRYYQRTIIIQGSHPYSRLDNPSTNSVYAPPQGQVVYTDYHGNVSYPQDQTHTKYTPDYAPPAYTPTIGVEKDPSFMR